MFSDRLFVRRSPVVFAAGIASCVVSYTVTFYVQTMNRSLFYFMMFLYGGFTSGLNNLVSASCAADIGKSQALKENLKSATTVIGIIDGTGALGSAVGQIIIGET